MSARAKWLDRRLLLALVAGGGLAAAFPLANLPVLAWLAPGLILFTAVGVGKGRAFRLGWSAGLVFALGALHWLWYIPVTFYPLLGWAALSAYVALYPGLWVMLAWRMAPGRSAMAAADGAPASPLVAWFKATAWTERVQWALGCAALWVALEMIICRFLSGFPWLLTGNSQYQLLPVIQIASVTGVYGVSFLVVWLSVSIGCAVAALIADPASRRNWVAEMALPLFCLVCVTAWGMSRLSRPSPQGRQLKLALVQPAIPQTMIWNAAENTNRFRQLIALSREALTNKPDVLIWPEAAVPGLIRYHEEIGPAISRLAQEHHTWIILGGDDAVPRPNAQTEADVDYYNSSFLVSPAGELVQKYDKRHLVMFGEYVPLIDWLPFVKYLTPIDGGFTPGAKPGAFAIPDHKLKAGMLICFEDIFPQSGREAAQADTDLLVNLTNDGWFGESSEQWQHAGASVFRAVENGRPLVRCTNNGLTCWVDAQGRMHEVYYPNDPNVYRAGYKIVSVPLPATGETPAATFYQRNGDVFGWVCVVISGLLLAATRKQAAGSAGSHA